MIAEKSVDVQINFSAASADAADEMVFELATDSTNDSGSLPVQVTYTTHLQVVVLTSTTATWSGKANEFVPLRMVTPGKKLVKVYCPESVAPSIRIIVDNGERVFNQVVRVETVIRWRERENYYFGMSRHNDTPGYDRSRIVVTERIVAIPVNKAVLIGRRNEPYIEAINWTGDVRKRLRYPYDNPVVEIIQQTTFWNKNGEVVPSPQYDAEKSEFFTAGEAYGGIVVRYSPGFSLFEISYDTGELVASPQLFEEMQRAWLFGDITKVETPPVRLIVLASHKAVTGSFERKIWPEGLGALEKEAAKLSSGTSVAYRNLDNPVDPFKDYGTKDEGATDTEDDDFNPDDYTDDTDDLDEPDVETWTEIPGTRETMMNRLYLSADDSEAFVDVELTTYLECTDDKTGRKFKLRMLNGVSDT